MSKLSEGEKHILQNQHAMMKWMIARSENERFLAATKMCGDMGRTEAVLERAGIHHYD